MSIARQKPSYLYAINCLIFDEPIEWLDHELFAISNVIENFIAKNEIAAIDPDVRLLAGPNPLHATVQVEFGKMEADRRMDRDEAADLAALFEPRDHLWQRRISERVTVVSEKDFLVADKVLNCC